MSRWNIFGIVCLVLAAAGCSSNSTNSPVDAGVVSLLPAVQGYTVSLWAAAPAGVKAPDSIDSDGTNVWVGYQNASSKTGAAGSPPSTIVEFNGAGTAVLQQINLPGHADGMRWDAAGKKLWVTSNEDANPALYSVDPTSGAVTTYTLPSPTPHQGGYDDLFFLNGKMFMVASNPTPDTGGAFSAPAVVSVAISGTTATLTPVLMGNATVTDLTQDPPAPVTLAVSDPDSLSVDGSGNLVLVDQGGTEIITISHPGEAAQSVSRIVTGSQLDDTVWASKATGQLLIADGKSNNIYSLRSTAASGFTVGTVFTQTPDDSGVGSFVGTVDLTPAKAAKTGYAVVTPIAIGFGKATGMYFAPQ